MNVFLCYGTARDQLLAFRLQVMAAVGGITAFVPWRNPDAAGRKMIQERLKATDLVLVLVSSKLGRTAVKFMEGAEKLAKPMLVMDGSSVSYVGGDLRNYIEARWKDQRDQDRVRALLLLASGLVLLDQTACRRKKVSA